MVQVTKELTKTFTGMAENLAKKHNPYKENATKRIIGKNVMYMFNNDSLTEKEITEFYVKMAVKDMIAGYQDRVTGYYDKGFSYSHSDKGQAYDIGQQYAVDNIKCPDKVHIIDCNN